MDYDALFAAYYTQYRAEATVPSNVDDEYTIGMRFANEAVNRWSNYDNTFWKELFDTNQNDGSGDQVIVLNQREYAAPDNMQEAGGFIKILDSNGNSVRNYQIIEPQEAQFRADSSAYAYFTGDPANGFTLNINPAPDISISGMQIDYVYYKKPTLFTTGADVSEMSEPYFIVNRMLASRFRASRNPYYQSAKGDAEDVLRTMKMTNDSGTWANPWSVADNSGTTWGASVGNGWRF